MDVIQQDFKKTWSVWFAGAAFAFMFFVLPCLMVTPVKTAEGKWKFIERTGDGGWITNVILLFFLASLIYFVIGVIRTKLTFERTRHEELNGYELFYAFSWTILLMSILMTASGWENMENLPLEFVFLVVPLFLFRKNLSLLGFRKHAFTWRVVGAIVLCYAAFWLADIGSKWLMSALSVDMYSAREELISSTLQEYLGKGQWISLVGEMAAISLVGPIWEEVLFRGMIQTCFMGKMRPFWAVLLSSVLFAVAHGDPSLVLSLFISGLLFGWLYAYTKSLWPSILLHILNNAVATILAVFFPGL